MSLLSDQRQVITVHPGSGFVFCILLHSPRGLRLHILEEHCQLPGFPVSWNIPWGAPITLSMQTLGTVVGTSEARIASKAQDSNSGANLGTGRLVALRTCGGLTSHPPDLGWSCGGTLAATWDRWECQKGRGHT